MKTSTTTMALSVSLPPRKTLSARCQTTWFTRPAAPEVNRAAARVKAAGTTQADRVSPSNLAEPGADERVSDGCDNVGLRSVVEDP